MPSSVQDPTNDPQLRSFIETGADDAFPIQNLPYGVFSPAEGGGKRIGVAIGDQVLDLSVIVEHGLLEMDVLRNERPFAQGTLNGFMKLGRRVWKKTRAAVSELLRADNPTLRDDEAMRREAF